jgi:SPX domain protein involved in polyphosphate accumulation
MKFAKKLEAQAIPEWKLRYLRYVESKHILKKVREKILDLAKDKGKSNAKNNCKKFRK